MKYVNPSGTGVKICIFGRKNRARFREWRKALNKMEHVLWNDEKLWIKYEYFHILPPSGRTVVIDIFGLAINVQ